MRVIWTARLVMAMAAVTVIASAAFAVYHTTGAPAGIALATAHSAPSRPRVPPPASRPPASTRPASPPAVTRPSAPPGTVLAHAVFSGAVARDLTGPLGFGSRFSGSCTNRAGGFFSLSFNHDEQIDYRDDHVSVYVSLPDGIYGPGTYDLRDRRLTIGAQYTREGLTNQSWTIVAAGTRAVLQVGPDASGTFTVLGLQPLVQLPPGDPLGRAENVAVSFTCA
jgi:hypothetical protein